MALEDTHDWQAKYKACAKQQALLIEALNHLDAIGMDEGIEHIPYPYRIRFRIGWSKVLEILQNLRISRL